MEKNNLSKELQESLKRHRELLGYDPTKGTTTPLNETRGRHSYLADNTDYAEGDEEETEEEGGDNPDFDFGGAEGGDTEGFGDEGTEEETEGFGDEGTEEETEEVDEFGTADEFSAADDIELEDAGEEVEEIDVTDIIKRTDDAKSFAEKAVTSSEEGKTMIQDLMTKFEALQQSLSKIDSVSDEITSIKKDLQAQKPKEKLELRSLDSYPFNVKLTDYWNDEKLKSNYEITDGSEPDAESKNGEVKVWKLDPKEAKDFSNVDIKKSFVPESKSKKKVLTENLILNSRQQTQFIDLLKNELPHEYRIEIGGMTESGIDFYDIEKDGGKHVSLTLNDVNSPEQYITLFRMGEYGDEDFLGDYEKIGSSVEEIFYNVKDNLIRDIKKSFVPESKSKKKVLTEDTKVSDINKMFNSFNAEEGQIKKIIQYLVQGRNLEASSFGNTKLVAEIKKYLNQIPSDKMEVLKKKKGEEIQNIFSGDSLKKLIDYLKKENLM